MQGGIPNRTTIFTTLSAGSTVAQIETALNACPSNQVVKLGAGTFTISSTINFNRHGVTLRGAGTNTVLRVTTGLSDVIEFGSDNPSTAGTSVTAGWSRGSSNLTVSSTASLAVDDLVSLSEVLNSAVMYDSDGTTTRAVRQQVLITAINGNILTIWPPVHSGLGTSPRVDRFDQSAVYRMSGVEDLMIDGNGQDVNWTILFQNTVNCWTKGVYLRRPSNYGISLYQTLFFEGTKCHVDEAQNYASNHAGYLLGNGSGWSASSSAIYDNITDKIAPGIEVNGGSSGNIVAYNFFWDAQLELVQFPSIDMNHGPECMLNLYEGNVTDGITSDGYFGGSLYDMVFRNWAMGWSPSFPSTHGRALWLLNDTLYSMVVGNVFGCTNIVPDAYAQPIPGGDWDANYVIAIGEDGSSTANRGGADHYDEGVTNTMIFHLNWDSVNKGSAVAKPGQDTTLPDSLYLTAKPTWFGNLTWPPVSHIVGYTNMTIAAIPAGYRYLNGTEPPADSSATYGTTARFGTMKGTFK